MSITILGAGFAALTAVREIRKRDKDIGITLIAPKAEFLYFPSLIWIPTGLRKSEDLVIDLTAFFARNKVEFIKAHVEALEEGGKLVKYSGGEHRAETLIIASGGRFLKKLSGIEHVLTICEGLKSAEEIKTRLAAMKKGKIAFGFATNPLEKGAMRGGPIFELLFGIETYLRENGRRDDIEISFFCPAPKPGARLGPKAVDRVLSLMDKRGIKKYIGQKIKGFEADKVNMENESFGSDLTIFMAGMTGGNFTKDSGLAMSKGGFFKADEFCRIEGCKDIYVAGDAGSFEGPDWMPKQGHIADLQAKAVVENIFAVRKGEEPKARFKPEMICIMDSHNKGALVYRSPRFCFSLPPLKILHWAKKRFEKQYMAQYRH